MNIYDFNVKSIDGSDVSLSNYKGNVLLVVNTATGCGFTPQYVELQNMYEAYKDQGFEILDFPCNQFHEQAPESSDEIHAFCIGRFGIKFAQFDKIDVNGSTASPLYKYLEEVAPFNGLDEDAPNSKMLDELFAKEDPDYKNNNNIKWNFTKFLIDRDGNVIARFEPNTDLNKIKTAIETLL